MRIIKIVHFVLALVVSSGANAQKYSNPHPVHLGPSCQFSVKGSCFGDTTFFINHTIRMMNPEWEIRDSTGGILYFSQDTNIQFLFPYSGTYSVTLKADNGHPDSITKALSIGSATTADFDFQQCSNQFINMSACADSFYWDFGDGATSSVSLPLYSYADTGVYVVTLIAINGAMADTLVKQIHIYGLGFPTGQFTYSQSNDTIYFQGDTIASSFSWDFGDQTYDTVMNPVHVYPDTGDFFVFVAVSNFCGMYIYSDTIHVSAASGINQFHNSACDFTLHPNPVTSGSVVLLSECVNTGNSVRILDVLGREIKSEQIPPGKERYFNVDGLDSGVYFFGVFKGPVLLSVQKLIVQ